MPQQQSGEMTAKQVENMKQDIHSMIKEVDRKNGELSKYVEYFFDVFKLEQVVGALTTAHSESLHVLTKDESENLIALTDLLVQVRFILSEK